MIELAQRKNSITTKVTHPVKYSLRNFLLILGRSQVLHGAKSTKEDFFAQSRKGRKEMWRSEKPETRNPKFETNPNGKKAQNSKQARFTFRI
jgi:hypothetical protein